MHAVAEAHADIVAALAAIAPAHEGLRDYARLNLSAATVTEVKASMAVYDKRVKALEVAKAAIEALLADGYPALEPRTVTDAVLTDLRANNATIAAALAQFRPEGAAAITLTAGAPEPKG